MSKDKVITGIDIGTSKITTVIGLVEETSINVIGVSSLPAKGLKKGQIVDIDEAVSVISSSLESAERMAGFSAGNAFITAAGSHIESQNSKGVVAVSHPEGEITAEDVLRVVEAARAISLPSSKEILHVIPRYFVIDSQSGIKDPVGMNGVRLEVETHIVTGATTSLRNIAKCASKVGIGVSGMVFSGLASSYAVLTETEKELGVILIDFGGGATDVCIFTEGAPVHSAVLPIGARNVTNDLAIGLRISLDSAEKIKLALSVEPKTAVDVNEDGDVVDKKESDQLDLSGLGLEENLKNVSKKTITDGIIKPRLREILNMIKLEIQKSGYLGLTPSGVVMTGGGSETAGVIDIARQELGMPVRIGLPQGATGLVDEIDSPAFAASLGLVIYGSQFQQDELRIPLVGKIEIKNMVSKSVGWLRSKLP